MPPELNKEAIQTEMREAVQKDLDKHYLAVLDALRGCVNNMVTELLVRGYNAFLGDDKCQGAELLHVQILLSLEGLYRSRSYPGSKEQALRELIKLEKIRDILWGGKDD
jgi:hypothetical protein